MPTTRPTPQSCWRVGADDYVSSAGGRAALRRPAARAHPAQGGREPRIGEISAGAAAARGRGGGGAGARRNGRAGERVQGALPRRDVARAAHAAQRHPRLHAAARARRRRRPERRHSASTSTGVDAQRRAPARAGQRRARSVQGPRRQAAVAPGAGGALHEVAETARTTVERDRRAARPGAGRGRAGVAAADRSATRCASSRFSTTCCRTA